MARYPKGYKMTEEEKKEFWERTKVKSFADLTKEERDVYYKKRSENNLKKKVLKEQTLQQLAKEKRDRGAGKKWVEKLHEIATAKIVANGAVKPSDNIQAINTLGKLTGDLSDKVEIKAVVGVVNWRDYVSGKMED